MSIVTHGLGCEQIVTRGLGGRATPAINPLFVKDPDIIYIGGETELQNLNPKTDLVFLGGETELQLVK